MRLRGGGGGERRGGGVGRLIEGGGLGRPAGKNLQILDLHRLASLSNGPEKFNYGTASFTFKKEKCAARSP